MTGLQIIHKIFLFFEAFFRACSFLYWSLNCSKKPPRSCQLLFLMVYLVVYVAIYCLFVTNSKLFFLGTLEIFNSVVSHQVKKKCVNLFYELFWLILLTQIARLLMKFMFAVLWLKAVVFYFLRSRCNIRVGWRLVIFKNFFYAYISWCTVWVNTSIILSCNRSGGIKCFLWLAKHFVIFEITGNKI